MNWQTGAIFNPSPRTISNVPFTSAAPTPWNSASTSVGGLIISYVNLSSAS